MTTADGQPRPVRGYPHMPIPIPSEALADAYDRGAVRLLTDKQTVRRDARQLQLAERLHTFVYGDREWSEEEREAYLEDADTVLRTLPHLLPLDLRDDVPFED